MEHAIIITMFFVCWLGTWILVMAYKLGGSYYIKGNFGKRKGFLRRMFDGLKIIIAF